MSSEQENGSKVGAKANISTTKLNEATVKPVDGSTDQQKDQMKNYKRRPYNNLGNTNVVANASDKDANVLKIKDGSVDLDNVPDVTIGGRGVRGMATIESTLNSMTGDISYEDLLKIPGVSTMALRAKENVGDISIFQRKDYMSSIDSCSISDISYHNIPLLLKFISANGRIVPSRISSVSYAVQKELERAIKIARFLGLLPYVEY